jgi:futalosine hydrolase
MKVVITAATKLELNGITQRTSKDGIERRDVEVSFHVSGIGILHSCYSITRVLLEQKPDLIIQTGIAGCFDMQIPLGKLVTVEDEVVGDMGAEEDGNLQDLFDMKFHHKDAAPYSKGKLTNPWLRRYNLLHLDEVSGLTVNEISTRKERINHLVQKYNPVIESMEGAALHYTCLQTQVPFIQLRAVSNYIGERDKRKWKLVEALNNLSEATTQYLRLLDH